MISFDDLVNDKKVQEEYKKAVLLSIFKKIISREKYDDNYRRRINNLFKQSFNQVNTVKMIVEQDFNCKLDDDEAKTMSDWFIANQRKSSRRRQFSKKEKEELCDRQNNKCLACGKDLGTDYSKIHVDHIIPWVLVGDELEDNYQVLCETCNESKSSRTDYMISKLLKII